jgi:hypothetical protein
VTVTVTVTVTAISDGYQLTVPGDGHQYRTIVAVAGLVSFDGFILFHTVEEYQVV